MFVELLCAFLFNVKSTYRTTYAFVHFLLVLVKINSKLEHLYF